SALHRCGSCNHPRPMSLRVARFAVAVRSRRNVSAPLFLGALLVFAIAACSGDAAEGDGEAGGANTMGGDPGQRTDGTRNGDESDVDCGGSNAPKCADGKNCNSSNDCTSGICKGSTCSSPAPDDGVKNGDETDVDCGGAKAPKCAVDKGCKA